MDWLEKNGENKKERYNKRNLRSGCFSGLEKPGKECVDIGVEDFSKGNKFRYLDVHTVGFQLGISAFGHRNPYLHRRFFPGMCVDGRLKYFSASVRINWHWTAIRYALHRESKGTGCLCHWHISCVQWVLVGSVRLKLDITKSVIPFSWKSIVIFFNAQRKAMILIHL